MLLLTLSSYWNLTKIDKICYFFLCLSVLPYVQDIFRRIFLSNCWWQKSDIWSQASYRYTILWVAFFVHIFCIFVLIFLYVFFVFFHLFLGYFTNIKHLTKELFLRYRPATSSILGNHYWYNFTIWHVCNQVPFFWEGGEGGGGGGGGGHIW
jgi:hypothetical protein